MWDVSVSILSWWFYCFFVCFLIFFKYLWVLRQGLVLLCSQTAFEFTVAQACLKLMAASWVLGWQACPPGKALFHTAYFCKNYPDHEKISFGIFRVTQTQFVDSFLAEYLTGTTWTVWVCDDTLVQLLSSSLNIPIAFLKPWFRMLLSWVEVHHLLSMGLLTLFGHVAPSQTGPHSFTNS